MNEWKNGLPPVGEIVEMIHPGIASYGWQKVEIVCYPKQNKVLIKGDCPVWADGLSITHIDEELLFRPIQTEEEQQRDEDVEAMCVIADKPTLWLHSICEELYDAGYRKVTPLSDEEIKVETSRRWSTDFEVGARWSRDYILGGQDDA